METAATAAAADDEAAAAAEDAGTRELASEADEKAATALREWDR